MADELSANDLATASGAPIMAASRAAISWLAVKRVFCRGDFEVDAHGVVRLTGPLAREIAALVLRAAPGVGLRQEHDARGSILVFSFGNSIHDA